MGRLTIVGGVFAVVIALVAKTVYDAGEFTSLKEKGMKSCRLVTDLDSGEHIVGGLEDLVVDFDKNVVFGGADDRAHLKDDNVFASPAPMGQMLMFDQSSNNKMTVCPITNYPFKHFHPHGLSLLPAGQKQQLFVVNHRADRSNKVREEAIDIFDVEYSADGSPPSFSYVESITGGLLETLNDVVAVSPTEFYATNWLYYKKGFMREIETLTQRPWSYVVFCGKTGDKWDCKQAAGNIKMANGISASLDGKLIYVSALVEKAVHVFERNSDNTLRFKHKIFVDTGCDNLFTAEDGSVYSACHPKLLSVMMNLQHPKTFPYAPSQVLRIVDPLNPKSKVEKLLMHNGSKFSASSAAVPFGDSVLVGAVLQPAMLACDALKP